MRISDEGPGLKDSAPAEPNSHATIWGTNARPVQPEPKPIETSE